MLVVLIPFVVGILIADNFVLPFTLVAVFFFVTEFVAWMLLPRDIAAGYVAMALILFGYLDAELLRPIANIPCEQDMLMGVKVVGEVIPREGYSVAEGRVVWWEGDDSSEKHPCCERVQLWIRHDSIRSGDMVEVYAALRERISRYAGYDELMHRRGYVGGVGLESYNVVDIEHGSLQSLHLRALERLRRSGDEGSAQATVEAMVAGSRGRMPKTVSEAYSKTGLMHLMAVSGLHLGIVVLLVNILVKPLCLIHRGHIAGSFIVVVALWLFALMSGMSPSVVRAATMLSILQLARATSSRYNSLNALAMTIFIMLAFHPDNLFDISFELSVAAVMGILLWGVPLMRVMSCRGAIRWVCNSLIIGVVATLWTLPLVSHTFGNVPIIGVLVTPMAMFTAYVIVGFGTLSLLFPQMIAELLLDVARYAAELQNWMVELAALPAWSSVEYRLGGDGVLLFYALYGVITLVAWSIDRKKRVTLPRYDL